MARALRRQLEMKKSATSYYNYFASSAAAAVVAFSVCAKLACTKTYLNARTYRQAGREPPSVAHTLALAPSEKSERERRGKKGINANGDVWPVRQSGTARSPQHTNIEAAAR